MMPGLEHMMMPSLMQQPPSAAEAWYGSASAEDMWSMGMGSRFGGKGGKDLAALSNSHCRYWRFGRCARGETCFYKHDLAFLGVDRPGSNGIPLPAPPPTAGASPTLSPSFMAPQGSGVGGLSMAASFLKASAAAAAATGGGGKSPTPGTYPTLSAHGGAPGTTLGPHASSPTSGPGSAPSQFLDFNSPSIGNSSTTASVVPKKNKDGETLVAGARRFKGYVQSYAEEQGCGLIAGDEVTQFFGTQVFLGLDQVAELTGSASGKLAPGVRLSFTVVRNEQSGQPKARDLQYEQSPEIQVDPAQAKIEADIARFKGYVAEAEGRMESGQRSRSRSPRGSRDIPASSTTQ